jgi:hypothetical protein
LTAKPLCILNPISPYNVSNRNLHLRVNYGNFNFNFISHTMLIQRGHSGEVGGVICKGVFANQHTLSIPLDQHCVTQIEFSIVCMLRLVSTGYVVISPTHYCPSLYCFQSSLSLHLGCNIRMNRGEELNGRGGGVPCLWFTITQAHPQQQTALAFSWSDPSSCSTCMHISKLHPSMPIL